jgi:hypothetical protein
MKYFAILLLLVSGVVSANYVDDKFGPDGNKVSGVEVNDRDIYESGNNTVTYTVYTVKIKGLEATRKMLYPTFGCSTHKDEFGTEFKPGSVEYETGVYACKFKGLK